MLLRAQKICLQLEVAIVGLSIAFPFHAPTEGDASNIDFIVKPEISKLENYSDGLTGKEDPSLFEESRPEESGYFEGDIVGINGSFFSGRNAILDFGKKWSDGIIPYTFKSYFNSEEKKIILAAMEDFHKNTCIRFIKRSDERSYIRLNKGKGCYSTVGRVDNGYQDVSLGEGCVTKGIVIHELMHAVGFWHEQSRADRDDHVIVHWENIKKVYRRNFLKYSWMKIQHLNESYDIASVMHYGPYAFSIDADLRTIEPKDSAYLRTMGQRVGFSKIDIVKINKLYSCRDDNLVEGKPQHKPSRPRIFKMLLQLLNFTSIKQISGGSWR